MQCRRSTLPSYSQSQMSEPQQPIVLSDEEEDRNALSSTPPFRSFHHSKRRRTELDPYPNPPPTVLVLDDDDDGPTSFRYLVLDESPCTKAPSDYQTQTRVSHSQHKFSGWLLDFCFCFTLFVSTTVIVTWNCLILAMFILFENYVFMHSLLCFGWFELYYNFVELHFFG